MPAPVDVLAIGNALVDVLAPASPEFLEAQGIPKGGMRLIGADEAETLYAAMGPGREVSGGSAANTVAGMAALGAKPAFVGRVAQDQLGDVFAHDIRASGVSFTTTPSGNGAHRPLPHRRHPRWRPHHEHLPRRRPGTDRSRSRPRQRRSGADPLSRRLPLGPARPARRDAQGHAVARAKGRKVALTLSDVFCVNNHRADWKDCSPAMST